MSPVLQFFVAMGISTLLGCLYIFGVHRSSKKAEKPRANMSSINIGAVRSGRITINGLTFHMVGSRLFVNNQEWAPIGIGGATCSPPITPEPVLVLEADGTLKGPFKGEIYIYGTQPVTLKIEGDVTGNVTSNFDVHCGSVTGSVDAGSNVECGTVGGAVDAGNSVACGNVAKNVDAGGSIQCGSVGGNVDAGDSVTCGDVEGRIDAGGSVYQTMIRNVIPRG